MAERKGGKRAYFTAARRDIYLGNLGRTGNHKAAARDAGISPSAVRRYRARKRDYKALCTAAVSAAQARLAGAQGPEDGDLDPAFESIRRGADGRLKIQARGKRRWSSVKENLFFAVLRECGNIAASARAAGVSRETVWQRRRNWPAFARRLEATLDEAEVNLEFRVACLGTNWTEMAASEDGEPFEIETAPGELDHEFALRFLKFREDKRRGRRSPNARALPPIEVVRENILRKLDAIERHEAANKDG